MASLESVLVMAGTREAHGIVAGLQARGRRIVASLPEPERSFRPLTVPTRMGRFVSPTQLLDWLVAERVLTIIDASHGFDRDISEMARQAGARAGARYLRVLRPVWRPTFHDDWQLVPTIREAARIAPSASRVFSNTGWPSVSEFASFRGERLFLRQTQPADRAPPFDFVEFVYGEPPFLQAQEEKLFLELGVTHLVVRNVGGAASRSKLFAARQLGLPVYMVERPAVARDCPTVETVAEALAWEADG